MVNQFISISKAISREVADFLFSRSQENIVEMGISDTGALLQSGIIKEEADDVIVEYSAPYAQAINDGAKPHNVNPKQLEGWVKRKLGVPKSEVPKVARAIANKIKNRGTKPQPFIDSAIAQTSAMYKGQVDIIRE